MGDYNEANEFPGLKSRVNSIIGFLASITAIFALLLIPNNYIIGAMLVAAIGGMFVTGWHAFKEQLLSFRDWAMNVIAEGEDKVDEVRAAASDTQQEENTGRPRSRRGKSRGDNIKKEVTDVSSTRQDEHDSGESRSTSNAA